MSDLNSKLAYAPLATRELAFKTTILRFGLMLSLFVFIILSASGFVALIVGYYMQGSASDWKVVPARITNVIHGKSSSIEYQYISDGETKFGSRVSFIMRPNDARMVGKAKIGDPLEVLVNRNDSSLSIIHFHELNLNDALRAIGTFLLWLPFALIWIYTLRRSLSRAIHDKKWLEEQHESRIRERA